VVLKICGGIKLRCLCGGRENEKGTDQTFIISAAFYSSLSALRPQLVVSEYATAKIRLYHLAYLYLFHSLSVQERAPIYLILSKKPD
jgi:hypothetical protein